MRVITQPDLGPLAWNRFVCDSQNRDGGNGAQPSCEAITGRALLWIGSTATRVDVKRFRCVPSISVKLALTRAEEHLSDALGVYCPVLSARLRSPVRATGGAAAYSEHAAGRNGNDSHSHLHGSSPT